MNVFNYLIVMALTLFSTIASAANPIEYYGTPVFYGKYSPDKVSCTYDTDSRYGFCGDDSAPIEGRVGVTNPNEPGRGVGVTVALFTEVICLEGICKSNYGEPLGQISKKGTSYWTIPTGYYLSDKDGQYVAYKQGTGPLGTKYRMKVVYVLPNLNDPVKGLVETKVNAYCNEDHDCNVLGVNVSRSDLTKWFPRVLTHECDPIFCYNSDRSIAGINPKTQGI